MAHIEKMTYTKEQINTKRRESPSLLFYFSVISFASKTISVSSATNATVTPV